MTDAVRLTKDKEHRYHHDQQFPGKRAESRCSRRHFRSARRDRPGRQHQAAVLIGGGRTFVAGAGIK
jgi:hypothetical protein